MRAAIHPPVPPVRTPIVCIAMASPLKMMPTKGAWDATSNAIAIGSTTFATLRSFTASESASYISSLMFCTAFMPRACHTACASAAESAAFCRRIFVFESCAVFHVIVSIPRTRKMTSATTTPTLPCSEARRVLIVRITSISTRLPSIPDGPCR